MTTLELAPWTAGQLTAREREVLAGLADGLSTTRVLLKLGVRLTGTPGR